MHSRWASLRAAEPSTGRLVRLPESGYGALVAWLAGPEHACGGPTVDPPPVVISDSRDGRRMRRVVARTPEVQAEVDDDVADCLAEAKVPTCPRACTWWLCLPEGLTEEAFWGAVHAAEHAGPPAPRPEQTAVVIAAVLPRLLDRPG